MCRVCKGLARKTPLQVRRRLRYMRLPEERPEEIVPAIRRGVEQTQRGVPALLEFITSKETAVSKL